MVIEEIERATATQLKTHQNLKDIRQRIAAKAVVDNGINLKRKKLSAARITPRAMPADEYDWIGEAPLFVADPPPKLKEQATIHNIQRAVCRAFEIRMLDLLSHRRMREIVEPRQIAMTMCRALMSKTLPEIGRGFGGRDHTTVLHAIRKFEWLSTALRTELGDEVGLFTWAVRARELLGNAHGHP